MLSREELRNLIENEEKRLGVGSKEFIEKHHEIMTLIDQARENGEKQNGDS